MSSDLEGRLGGGPPARSLVASRLASGPPARSRVVLWPQRVSNVLMPPWDDDDDWVGTPPEGHYSRDRAKPEFWQRPWPLAGAGMALLLVIVVIVLILR